MTSNQKQDKLLQYCRERGMEQPIYNIVSDRKGTAKLIQEGTTNQMSTLGGRTAWSATVTVQSVNYPARYWYDGQYVNNAKEDAAEIAYRRLEESQEQRLEEQRNVAPVAPPNSQPVNE